MLESVRYDSLKEAQRLGYPINGNLPLLEAPEYAREKTEIVRRLLALYAVVSASYGFPKKKAYSWLVQENLEDALTGHELSFLNNETSEAENNSVRWQVEALWVLAWAVGCYDNLDFEDSCSDNFIHMLPDLKNSETSNLFEKQLKRRELGEIVSKCDLAYCLHWGTREAFLTKRNIYGAVPAEVILERRRALEWIISDQVWDEVNLDT